MSLLDKLWDDTVAGPRPDSGLGKLRKYSTFSPRSNSGKESEVSTPRSFTEEASEDGMKVTRSIMIVKPSGSQNRDSPPVSPAGTTPPVSPFAGSAGKEAFRFRRRSASFAYENASGVGPRSPRPPYDL
ncbi:putative 50S ribosomal protein L18 [Capsicum annuum]|uniref:dormancy-associated protein homolog 3 n=1 Tax=Capsicum annuum TaxID=4072 RepID=UPI001FB168FF|nr:dormancy-associated protein homolog 3 [Capsicum annuum]KAF3615231.1 putative 50S ribosomal protein L18 [Capsicum annuum]KAF3618366.1 putative 50S ribosomal protein L18 [Capsicum annuum]